MIMIIQHTVPFCSNASHNGTVKWPIRPSCPTLPVFVSLYINNVLLRSDP